MVGSASLLLSGTWTQLSEEEDCIAVAVCSAGDLHRHLEPRQKKGTTSRSVWDASDWKMEAKNPDHLFYIRLYGGSSCCYALLISVGNISCILFYNILARNFNKLPEIFSAVNMGSLINCARQKGKWDFFCRTKQLVLISCLEDSTNEVELPNVNHNLFFLVQIEHIKANIVFLYRFVSFRQGYCWDFSHPVFQMILLPCCWREPNSSCAVLGCRRLRWEHWWWRSSFRSKPHLPHTLMQNCVCFRCDRWELISCSVF